MTRAKVENKPFQFTAQNRGRINEIVAKYPSERKQSAILPLLDLAQRQSGGWLPHPAIEAVAEELALPPMRVLEVASFYTMFNLKPVGKNHIQVCTTTPCWLQGSDKILRTCQDELALTPGQTSEDGLFSVCEVECLGACSNAPVVQINDDYYEDLDETTFRSILNNLTRNKAVHKGSQIGRRASEPFKQEKEPQK